MQGKHLAQVFSQYVPRNQAPQFSIWKTLPYLCLLLSLPIRRIAQAMYNASSPPSRVEAQYPIQRIYKCCI